MSDYIVRRQAANHIAAQYQSCACSRPLALRCKQHELLHLNAPLSAIVSPNVGLKTVVAVVLGVGDSRSSHRMTGCMASHCGQVICQLLCCYLRRVCQTRSHWQRHCCTLARHSGPKNHCRIEHTSWLTTTTSWPFGIIVGRIMQAGRIDARGRSPTATR
jgi:hypothetical protein